MKDFFAKLLEKASQPKIERLLMILLPCLALAICAAILSPSISVYRANKTAALNALNATPEPTPIQEQEDWTQLYLNATSTSEDLYITVCDASGSPVTGVRFQLTLISPNGDEIICTTYEDGGCYLVELVPGKYSISMSSCEGYKTAESIECEVFSATHYAASLDSLSPGLNVVDGKLYYRSVDGRTARSIGLDISCYNEFVDFDALREQGIDFVILRVGGRGWGSGNIYLDTSFYKYFIEAREAGLKVGVYFYSTATSLSEAAEEAKFIADMLNGAPLELPVYFDSEYSGSYPYGRADRLSPALRQAILTVFADTLKQRGYETGFYSGTYFIQEELSYQIIAPYSVWIANYTANNALPSVNYKYDLWQYTESGRISGISGTVDINVVF